MRDARGRRGVRVVARDDGPGIEDLERALTDGYTTGGGLGLGLPGARRLVDEFDIQTGPGEGTTVTLIKWAAAWLRTGRRRWTAVSPGVAHEGEARSGDLAVFVADGGGRPGLRDRRARARAGGRGRRRAVRRGRARATPRPAARELLEACHEALLETRGVVMTVAWFDLERSQLSWAGVGNVDARLVRAGPGAARGRRARLRRRARLPDAAGAGRRRWRSSAATCW